MVTQQLLDILRCPMDPHRQASLAGDAWSPDGAPGQLVCQRCRLVFPMRDGFPSLLVEEAELPPGCGSLEQLPCQRGQTS